jgi:hypothetical protein
MYVPHEAESDARRLCLQIRDGRRTALVGKPYGFSAQPCATHYASEVARQLQYSARAQLGLNGGNRQYEQHYEQQYERRQRYKGDAEEDKDQLAFRRAWRLMHSCESGSMCCQPTTSL